MKYLLGIAIAILGALSLVFAQEEQVTMAAGLLRINNPNTGDRVQAGTMIMVSGTSAPENATHTNCKVGVILNGDTAQPFAATPTATTSTSKYTTWTASVGPMVQGTNSIEGELKCFAPGINPSLTVSMPNLIKHLVHNVTAIGTAPLPAPSAGPLSSGTLTPH